MESWERRPYVAPPVRAVGTAASLLPGARWASSGASTITRNVGMRPCWLRQRAEHQRLFLNLASALLIGPSVLTSVSPASSLRTRGYADPGRGPPTPITPGRWAPTTDLGSVTDHRCVLAEESLN